MLLFIGTHEDLNVHSNLAQVFFTKGMTAVTGWMAVIMRACEQTGSPPFGFIILTFDLFNKVCVQISCLV